MLAGAPTFAEVHPYLAGLLSGRVVVGHNVDRFDLAFLLAECRRLGEDLAPGGWSPSTPCGWPRPTSTCRARPAWSTAATATG